MRWALFLLAAVAVMAIGLGVVANLLLPQIGIDGPLARAIGAGLAGAVIAILYFRMIKRSTGGEA